MLSSATSLASDPRKLEEKQTARELDNSDGE
jgi:hypothetical protein